MMSEGFLRLFVAVDIGAPLRAALAERIRLLRKTHPRVKWVAAENIHLTLAFLGEVPAERVEEIGAALDTVAAGFPVFSCGVRGLGWFGSPRSPRVVWAGFEPEPELLRMQAGVAAALRDLGFVPEDRPFHPHLTLGRVKSARDAEGLAEILKPFGDREIGRMVADRILTIRSTLLPRGPEYTILRESPLPSVNRG